MRVTYDKQPSAKFVALNLDKVVPTGGDEEKGIGDAAHSLLGRIGSGQIRRKRKEMAQVLSGD